MFILQLYCVFARTTLAFTITLALRADIITEHCTQNEILFGAELVEWARYHHPDCIQTLFSTEENIHSIRAHRLNDIVDMLMRKTLNGKLFVASVGGIKHHSAHAFLIFVYVIHQHFQIG